MNLLRIVPVLILIFIKNIICLYLNNNQIMCINNLIKNNKLNTIERNKINIILYKAYEKFAIKKAFEFKYLYKCYKIVDEELIFCSKIGLYKSIMKYNGKFSLANYSLIYIYSELYKLTKEKYGSSQKNHNNTFGKYETMNTNIDSNIDTNEIIINKYNNYEIINNIINKQDAFTKRILYLKYFSKPNMNLSNKHISKLMCCSEESIRQSLLQIKI